MIYEFDGTYRQKFSQEVIPELELALCTYFKKIHHEFPGYVRTPDDLHELETNTYLKMTTIFEEKRGKWRCQGGVYINHSTHQTYFSNLGMTNYPRHRNNSPFFSAEILADLIYTDCYFFTPFEEEY